MYPLNWSTTVQSKFSKEKPAESPLLQKHIYDLMSMDFTRDDFAFLIKAIEENEQNNKCQLAEIILKIGVRDNYALKGMATINWYNLTYLSLIRNKIDSRGCKYLAKAEWPNLVNLNLWDNQIGVSGCKELVKAQWDSLQQLDLQWNNVTQQGCRYLALNGWYKLKTILLWGNSIETTGYHYLKRDNLQIGCQQEYIP